MALIKCPGCGALISSKAAACHICGKSVTSIPEEMGGEETKPAPVPVPVPAPTLPLGVQQKSSNASKLIVSLLITLIVLIIGLVVGVFLLLKRPSRQPVEQVYQAPAESSVPDKREDVDSPSRTSSSNIPGIYPEGSTRYLSEYDLMGKSLWELKVMRNEIYARHHYIFKSDDLIDYFARQSWYTGYDSDAKAVARTFNDYETQNIYLIRSYERALKHR
jgi:hypothetical protein